MSFAFNHPSHFSNPGRCENKDLSWDELNEEIKKSVKVESRDKKADAGFISPARYEKTRRQAKYVEAVTAIFLDVDERCPDLPVLERRMKALGWSATIYETVSSTPEQRKVRVLVEITSPIVRGDESVKEYGKRVGAIQKAVATQLGVVPDAKCVGDVGRIFYRPCHVEGQKVYFKRFKGDAIDPAPFEPLGLLGKIDLQATAEKAGLVTPEKENSNGNYELDECPFADCHSNKKQRGGAFIGQHYAIHCDHTTCGNNEDQSGYTTRAFLNRMVLQGTIAFDDIVEEREPTPEELLATGEPFGLMADVENVLQRSGKRLRYNQFSQLPEVWTDDGVRLLSDSDEMMLRQMWPLVFEDQTAPSAEETHRAILTLGHEFRAYHPVKEWLDGLEWDGVSRIDSWLIDVCGAEDRADVRAYGAKFLVGAVKRIYEPGCQFDQMLVLVGPQGSKKSSTVRAMVHDTAWYSDNVELGVNPRQAIEQLAGTWIAEVPEMVGNSKREIDHIKHMITRRQDRARLSYAKNVTLHVRETVLIGTTNDDEILRDPTGARRFWLVEVDNCKPELMAEYREQLFAEAKVRMATERLWIDAEDAEAFALMKGQHQRYADNGPYYDLLRVHLERNRPCWIKVATVWKLIGIKDNEIKTANNVMNNNIRRAMAALGYEKKTVRWNSGSGEEIEYHKGWVYNPDGVAARDMVELYIQEVQGKMAVFEDSWGSKKVIRLKPDEPDA